MIYKRILLILGVNIVSLNLLITRQFDGDISIGLVLLVMFYVSDNYNVALKKFGDKSPDFMGAITDLTMTSCKARNEATPNLEGVLYESVASYSHRARHVRFPMNFSHSIVKHFDGKNDGLVSIESANWGTNYRLLEPKGKRGISHGDMVDLNRENIPDFDVREFYVELVNNLKIRGY